MDHFTPHEDLLDVKLRDLLFFLLIFLVFRGASAPCILSALIIVPFRACVKSFFDALGSTAFAASSFLKKYKLF